MSRLIKSLILVMMIMATQLAAYACSTCGCSEVCPIAVMETQGGGKTRGTGSDSIIGNMVLKLAYERDEKLQILAKHYKLSSNATVSSIGLIAAGTLGQNISSVSLLNPPDGHLDSYAPGIVGLALDGATNVAFATRYGFGHAAKKKIIARQIEIRNQVETVLNHLEFSKMTCPEAQHELVALIGGQGAKDFGELWKSSHDGVVQVSIAK